jgi:hypothetical protein
MNSRITQVLRGGFFTVLFSLLLASVFAQDIIVKTNNDRIEAKVLEIGLDEIKYKLWANLDGPTVSIEKAKVKQIIYANGTVQEIEIDKMDVGGQNYDETKVNNIRTQFLAPNWGHIYLGYERSISRDVSIDGGLGIIGPGRRETLLADESGFYIRGGSKFRLLKETVVKGEKYRNVLHGSFIKPELVFGVINYDVEYYQNFSNDSEILRASRTNFGLLLNFGKQWIAADIISIEINGGFGYGFQSVNQPVPANTTLEYEIYDFYNLNRNFSHTGSSFIGSFNLLVGVVF